MFLFNTAAASNFPSFYNVDRKGRDDSATGQKFGGGVLIVVRESLNSFRRRDLESYA